MARRILGPLVENPSCFSYPLLVIVVLCVFSLVTVLCASHRRKKELNRRREDSIQSSSSAKKLLTKLSSNIGERAHLMAQMLSWRKVDEGSEISGEFDGESEEAVWSKTIIMGERCRPLDFSGKIVYDSKGNLVIDSSKQEKTKKVGA